MDCGEWIAYNDKECVQPTRLIYTSLTLLLLFIHIYSSPILASPTRLVTFPKIQKQQERPMGDLEENGGERRGGIDIEHNLNGREED